MAILTGGNREPGTEPRLCVNAGAPTNGAAGTGAGECFPGELLVDQSNGASAISDAMSINVAQKAVVRAAQIDSAQWDVAASGTLRVVRTKSSANNVACTVFVRTVMTP